MENNIREMFKEQHRISRISNLLNYNNELLYFIKNNSKFSKIETVVDFFKKYGRNINDYNVDNLKYIDYLDMFPLEVLKRLQHNEQVYNLINVGKSSTMGDIFGVEVIIYIEKLFHNITYEEFLELDIFDCDEDLYIVGQLKYYGIGDGDYRTINIFSILKELELI